MGPTREFLKEYWPPGNQGSIIVTSQDKKWRVSPIIHHSMELLSLEEREGIEVITTYLMRHEVTITREESIEIFAESGGLPLALHQMISFLVAEDLSATDFLRRFRNSRAVDNSEWLTTSPNLATFLSLALTKLQPKAQQLLCHISILDCNSIPEFLLDGSETDDSSQE